MDAASRCFEVLRGAGVFHANKTSTLYGFVARVADGTRIAVRELGYDRLLFDLCFYTGVCATPGLEAERHNENRLTLYLDMAYVPAFHTHEPPETTKHT
ncbi:hypothetical protein AAVH_17059, partial [Aphelenchoides avenae]